MLEKREDEVRYVQTLSFRLLPVSEERVCEREVICHDMPVSSQESEAFCSSASVLF